MALRRGQLAQASPETISLVVSHFIGKANQGRLAATGHTNGDEDRGGGRGGRGTPDTPSKTQTLELAERIRSLAMRRVGVGLSSTLGIRKARETARCGMRDEGKREKENGEREGARRIQPSRSQKERSQWRGCKIPVKNKSTGWLKKIRRSRKSSNQVHDGDDIGESENEDETKNKDEVGMDIAEKREDDGEEEAEWEG